VDEVVFGLVFRVEFEDELREDKVYFCSISRVVFIAVKK
jgi:hypothetical protein